MHECNRRLHRPSHESTKAAGLGNGNFIERTPTPVAHVGHAMLYMGPERDVFIILPPDNVQAAFSALSTTHEFPEDGIVLRQTYEHNIF